MLDQSLVVKLQELYSYLGVTAEQVVIDDSTDTVLITLNVAEEEAGIFIGRYAETLDALQRLSSAIINNGRTSHLPVIVDVAGYRERRYARLVELADKLRSEVESYRTPRAFPSSLSATERRQIHLLFANDDSFTTYSQGQGASRRLYLALKTS